jgi:hypothetical protein
VVEAAPEPLQPTPVVETGPLPEGAPSVAATEQEAWQLYEVAFAAAVARRDEDALATLAQLQARFPGTGAAVLGAELSRQLEALRGNGRTRMAPALRSRLEVPLPLSPPGSAPSVVSDAPAQPSVVGAPRYATLSDALHDERPTLLARAEFVLFQTLHGVTLGIETCALSNGCGIGVTLVPLLTGGAAAWAALSFSDGGITAGHALAIDSGVLWGAWHGLAYAGISNTFNQATLGVVMVGQLAGMVGGHFAWQGLGLSAGDVSLMNSAGVWTGTFALLTTATLGLQGSTPGLFTLLLAASDVGLVGGALLSRVMPMSRGRTLVLDAGVLLGGLLGFAVQTAFVGSTSLQTTAASLLAGSAVGLVTAGILTQDWDLELVGPVKVQMGIAPTSGGGAQWVIGGRL